MQYALDSVQYAKNIARLLQCKVNGDLFRYITISNTYFHIHLFYFILFYFVIIYLFISLFIQLFIIVIIIVIFIFNLFYLFILNFRSPNKIYKFFTKTVLSSYLLRIIREKQTIGVTRKGP